MIHDIMYTNCRHDELHLRAHTHTQFSATASYSRASDMWKFAHGIQAAEREDQREREKVEERAMPAMLRPVVPQSGTGTHAHLPWARW